MRTGFPKGSPFGGLRAEPLKQILEIGVLRAPSEKFPSFGVIGDKDRRLKGVARVDFGEGLASGSEEVTNGVANAGANVSDEGGVTIEIVQGEEVSGGDVVGVDDIADQGAVGGWIVSAVNGGRDAWGVAAAEDGGSEGKGTGEILDDCFEGELGAAIGIERVLRMLFVEGECARRAIGGDAAGVKELGDVRLEYFFEEDERIGNGAIDEIRTLD